MSDRNLSLALRLHADSARFVAGLTQAEGGVRRFARGARAEFDAFRGAMGSVQGQLAQLGLGIGAVATLAQSARMDKSLGQIGQTAGVSKDQVAALRKELFTLAGDNGQAVDDLQQGFNNAVAAGLKMQEATEVIRATDKAMAVTSATANTLTAGLTVAATAFNIDLAKPGQALLLLDKMTVAGRQGNAELESLSDIFARVGVNAASANMGFDQTLAFIETLSLVERAPERLATLADSTLRLFTNLNYMKEAASATGVKFFEKNGERQDPVAILKDIKAQYDKLGSDKDRAIYLQEAFGKADLDTIKGLKTLLGGDALTKVGEFSSNIRAAGGTLERDLPAAISNAVDQTGRLKAKLREAADNFAQPINDTLQGMIKWGLDKKENGGLGLDGKDMIVGGLAGVVGLVGAARYGGKAVGALASRLGGTAAGVAEGKALEAAAGVTPVFVVNWPVNLGGTPAVPGMPTPTATTATTAGGAAGSWWSKMKPGAGAASTLALAAAPLAAIYGASEWAGDTSNDQGRVESLASIGNAIKEVLGVFGMNRDDAIAAQLDKNREGLVTEVKQQLDVDVKVKIDQDGRATGATVRTVAPGSGVDTGPTMGAA